MLRFSMLAALISLTLFAPTMQPAFAGDTQNQTAEVRFAFVFEVDPWADADHDGYPDPPPDPLGLLLDDLRVIVVGQQNTTSGNLVFKDLAGSPDPYGLEGTTWTADSFAKLVQGGHPSNVDLYVQQAGGQRPAYRSAILPSDIIDSEAHWITVDTGTGHMVVQEEFNLDTIAAVVIVTAEVRVE